jgi:hypothetical protein
VFDGTPSNAEAPDLDGVLTAITVERIDRDTTLSNAR